VKVNHYVGYAHASAHVGVLLDAQDAVFRILHRGAVLCEQEIQGLVGRSMSFQEYLKYMAVEAQTVEGN
jgi:hypothetical protein